MAKAKKYITSKLKPKRKFVLGGDPTKEQYVTDNTVYQATDGPTQQMQQDFNARQQARAEQMANLQQSMVNQQMMTNRAANAAEEERKKKEAEGRKAENEAAKDKVTNTVTTGATNIGKEVVKSKINPVSAVTNSAPAVVAGTNMTPTWASAAPAYTAQSAGYAAPTLVDPAMQVATSTTGELIPGVAVVGQNQAANVAATGAKAAETAGQMSSLATAGLGIGLAAAGEGVKYWGTNRQNKIDEGRDYSDYYRNTHYTGREAASQIIGSGFKGASAGLTVGSAVPGIGNAIGAAVGAQAGLMVGAGIAAKQYYDTKGVKVFGKQYGAKNKYDENLDPNVIAKREQQKQMEALANTATAMDNARLGSMTQYDTNTGFNLKTTTGQMAKYGGKLEYLKGGVAKPLGRGAKEYVGKKHEQGGIDLPGNIEVEGGETEQNNYIFSATLKLPTGITYAKAHKNLLKSGASSEEIKQLALSQEAAAGRNPNEIKTMKFAKYGGPLQYDNGGVVKFEDGGPFTKYQGTDAQFSSQKDIDRFNEEISKILINPGQYSAADVHYAKTLQEFLQKNQSEFARAFTKGNNVWIPVPADGNESEKWASDANDLSWTIDSPKNSEGTASFASQPSYNKSTKAPRPSMYVSQASNRTDEGIANTVTNKYFNTQEFPDKDPITPPVESTTSTNTQNTNVTTGPTTTYNPPITTAPPANNTAVETPKAETTVTQNNPPANTTTTNQNPPVTTTQTTNNQPVTTNNNSPVNTNTTVSNTSDNKPTINNADTKFQITAKGKGALDYTERDKAGNEIWAGENYEKQWKPLVSTTMGDAANADKVIAYLENYSGQDAADVKVKLAGKTREQKIAAINKLATDTKVGPFHNAVLEGINSTQTPPPPPAAPPVEDNKVYRGQDIPEVTVTGEKIPPLPNRPEYKDQNIGWIQGLPAVGAMFSNVKPANYTPELSSQYVQPGAIGRANIGRVSYNTERAANQGNLSAMNQALQNMSGPGAVAGMLAAKTKAEQQNLAIANAEQNANIGLAAKEAEMNAGISRFNVGNAMQAQTTNAGIGMQNAAAMNQARQYNAGAKMQTDMYNLETKLGAGEKAVNTIAQYDMDKRQLKASERYAKATDYSGALNREQVYNDLKRASQDPNNKDFYGKSEAELWDYTRRYDKQMYGDRGNVIITNNTVNKEEQKKFGGAKKYVSRLGDLKNVKYKV